MIHAAVLLSGHTRPSNESCAAYVAPEAASECQRDIDRVPVL